MRLPRCFLVALLASVLTGYAVERLPIEDFSRESGIARARLSPDGKRFAFLRDHQGKTSLHVMGIDDQKLSWLDLGEATLVNGAPKGVERFQWISNQRLVISTTVWDLHYGVFATNWDGGHAVPISGLEDGKINLSASRLWAREVVHCFYDQDQSILMLDRHEEAPGSSSHPDVLRVNTDLGLIKTVVKNPGEVIHWGVDFAGVARLGVLRHGQLSGAIYREDEQTPWRTILPLNDRTGIMRPVGFNSADGSVLVAALTDKKRWTVFPLSPAGGALGAPLLADDEYDIFPDRFVPSVDGIALAGPLFSRKKQSLVGLRYVTELPRTKWFDREFAGYQQIVDKNLPDTVNILVDESLDGRRMLWLGFSDTNPGSYYLIDKEKHTFKSLGACRNWIKPAQMAPMLAVKYGARDGLLIHGYLTVPVGYKPKDLPVVIMPHGGPWVRDVWGYDPLVQLLANRGYAVLQMNYRGSTGYGDELYQEARKQIGGKIQDDIEDATRWAIAAGVADPKRIAVMGASYGGYSTLFALGHNPELYRCGISMAGVTDWPAIYEASDVAENKAALKYWREQIGDPKIDDLRSISPVNFAEKITAPVLIIQGKQDQRVPQSQAKRMIAALEKTGRKPESLFLADVGHSYGNEKKRTEIFKCIAAFLEANLGPGVP